MMDNKFEAFMSLFYSKLYIDENAPIVSMFDLYVDQNSKIVAIEIDGYRIDSFEFKENEYIEKQADACIAMMTRAYKDRW